MGAELDSIKCHVILTAINPSFSLPKPQLFCQVILKKTPQRRAEGLTREVQQVLTPGELSELSAVALRSVRGWKIKGIHDEKSSFYICKVSYWFWLYRGCLSRFYLQSGSVVIPVSGKECFEAKYIDISKVFIVTCGKGFEVINHSFFIIRLEECEANAERMSQFMSRRN